MRDLTPEENARLLTQEQVDALPANTCVMVKWIGGNGPHEYRTTSRDGGTFALRKWDDPSHPAGDFRLLPVGREICHVRVFISK